MQFSIVHDAGWLNEKTEKLIGTINTSKLTCWLRKYVVAFILIIA